MLEDIERFLVTIEGKASLQKYFEVCQINPQNIYVETYDYIMRYKKEHVLLEKCFAYFAAKGCDLKRVLADIPEILEYYPYFKQEVSYEQNKNICSMPFYAYLRELNIDFYETINPRRYGEYYTSIEMMEVALPELECHLDNRVIDPSCGSGFILYAYVNKVINEIQSTYEKEEIINCIHSNIYGFDVFPIAIITTKLLLGFCLYEKFGYVDKVFEYRNIKVINTLSTLKCNSTKISNIPQFDLIIGNPPFFRVNPNNSENVCKCTQYGHHYSHSLFLHWTMQYLKEKGVFCLILPESMLTGYYYQKVREELLSTVAIKNIIINKEHEKMFDVQQDVMILIGQRGPKNDYYYTSTSDIIKKSVKRYKLPIELCQNQNFVIPVIMNDKNLELLKDVSQEEIVSELESFRVCTGNYVWNQNKEKCFMTKGKKRIPLISGPSIMDGKIVVDHNRKNTYMYCEPDKQHYTLNKKAILFRRMSPMENAKRFIGAIIEPEKIGRYVVENHVNIVNGDEDYLDKMYSFLDSDKFNEVLKMFCRTNQVSVSDINVVFEILTKLRKARVNAQ